MPPTRINTQLIGWLRKLPIRVRLQAVDRKPGSAARILSLADTGTVQLPQKDLLVLLFLFGKLFRVEIVHLDKLNLVGVGQWGIDPFTVYKLT